ncbi:DUF58 domain-containing protein [Aestuariicella hydrocarbonica]|uniref:DUF58 domain-containing protein n=1 Tax=Pseudomaricurvus hydrocarbonicus TaxID=1470433 RepID=A0A9E5MMG7_9GAMM|nr:DUF58 domain-containing protein [Aestuariicella hydrocarbonica]NHO66530.1 DUF58 domain-containing protein [Aestuariicella hydrocarbonica]
MAAVKEVSDSAGVTVTVADLVNLQYEARKLPFSHSHSINNPLVGRHRSSVRGRGLNFEELRQYRVGDDIRQMDWKVTNRTRKPHVRIYAEERERPVLLVVDQRLSMFFGSRRAMKSVAAAEVAALLGWQTLFHQDRVGALIFGDDDMVELKPRRSQTHLLQVFHRLSDYNQKLREVEQGRAGQLNEMLTRLLNLARHDSLIYLITDLDGADDTSKNLLSQLQNHNDVILGWIYDPMEQHLPEGGKLAVSDGEYQVEVDTADSQLRQEFEQQFRERLETARQLIRNPHIPILSISTDRPVAAQWLALMGGRL